MDLMKKMQVENLEKINEAFNCKEDIIKVNDL
jgi:hypothetical protein